MIIFSPKTAYFFSQIRLFAVLFFALQGLAFASGGGISASPNSSIKMLTPVQEISIAPKKENKILPYQAQYKISSNSLTTTATRTLSKQGNNWLLSQQAKLLFVKVNETSIIEGSTDGLRPLHYEYSNNMSSRQDQSIDFDWSTHSAADSKYRKPWSSAISEDTFDQLGSQLKMREALMTHRLGDEISQTVLNRGKHKIYTIEKLGEETIDSAVGRLHTVKLLRSRPGRDSETTIWLAKDWNYLIVRLEQHDDDGDYSLELIEATLNKDTAVTGL